MPPVTVKLKLCALLCVVALLSGLATAQDESFGLPEGMLGAPAGTDALSTNNCGPTGDLRGDPENGKELHYKHCVSCHGLTGEADVVVMHMDETPRDQSDPEFMKTLPDSYLYLAICRGGEGVGRSFVMSPWGDFFTDQEIKDMIAWIRTFSDT
ncbi:MAG: cytochrome c [Gammaproteobacteria bacterium]|jgi:cytochrome c553|nr:cytochrome c [Gammaproteobacteria bacterium]